MSMLSEQCDRLRAYANKCRTDWCDWYAPNGYIAMSEDVAQMLSNTLEQAADTILELRNKANAELDVLQGIDQLRRDLSGYHGQLKAHNDLQRHCDNQRARIAELEAIHARDRERNDRFRKLAARMARALGADSEWADPTCCAVCCEREFHCGRGADGGEVRCPIVESLWELGVVE